MPDIICAQCGAQTRLSDECSSCRASPLLQERYRLERLVGQGAFGVTYEAERLEDGLKVAIKELPFSRLDSFKTKALFQREANVLRQLDHPQIPDYLDDFTEGQGKHLALYLVQEFVDGTTLAEELKDRRYDEREVLAILAEVGETLTYLHGLTPPVIHRDIKPGNIMRRRRDDSLVLLDFGSVRDALEDAQVGGSTVVGTFGYMPPEQYQGRASPASDLYALGATAVELLSRRPPETMLDLSQQLRWEAFVHVTKDTRDLLQDMLLPSADDRLATGRDLVERVRELLAASVDAPVEDSSVTIGDDTEDDTEDEDEDHDPGPVFEATPDPPSNQPSAATAEKPDKTRSASLAAVIIAGAVVAAIAIVFATELGTQDPPPPPSYTRPLTDVVAQAKCGEDGCEPVPRGLKDLEFGMTRDKAQQVLPELADARDASPSRVTASDGTLLNLNMIGFTEALPGFALAVDTTIGSHPATCRLEFADDEKLSAMKCTLNELSSMENHRAVEEQLLTTLQKRYGRTNNLLGGGSAEPVGFGHSHKGKWVWRDDGAMLILESEYTENRLPGMDGPLSKTSNLSLNNLSPRHQELIDEAEARARERAETEQRKKENEERRRVEEERKRLERQIDGGELFDDL